MIPNVTLIYLTVLKTIHPPLDIERSSNAEFLLLDRHCSYIKRTYTKLFDYHLRKTRIAFEHTAYANAILRRSQTTADKEQDDKQTYLFHFVQHKKKRKIKD